jgi:formate hydrogenlyase subunit 4
MTVALEGVLRLAVWLLVAPLLPGLINRVKSWVAGRRGPPVLQLYYDLAKLWRKGVVLSSAVSPIHVAGPAVAWVAVATAALLLPLGPGPGAFSFRGDALLFVYLLALARFGLAGAALDTGSAFEGMGAAREVSYAILAEAGTMTALLTLGVQSGSVSLGQMLAPSAGAGAALLAAGLFAILLAENCRVPFDDPNTHLELTMIHEVMVLDHSGPPLAAILHGASVKLLLFAVLLVEAVLPLGDLAPLAAAGALAAGVLVVAVSVGLVESLLARLAFRRVPMLLTTAFLLCLFALLAAWKQPPSREPHPERGLQSAGGHDFRPASAPASAPAIAPPLRAETRAPHEFTAAEQPQTQHGTLLAPRVGRRFPSAPESRGACLASGLGATRPARQHSLRCGITPRAQFPCPDHLAFRA